MIKGIENIEFQLRLFMWLALIFFIAGIFPPIFLFCLKKPDLVNHAMDSWGSFGDFLGGTTGALWSAAGACVVYMAFLGQMLETRKNEVRTKVEDISNYFDFIDADSVNIQTHVLYFSVYRGDVDHLRLSRILYDNFQTDKISTTHRSNSLVVEKFGEFISTHRVLRSFFERSKKIIKKIYTSQLSGEQEADFLEELQKRYGSKFIVLFLYFTLLDDDKYFMNLLKEHGFFEVIEEDTLLASDDVQVIAKYF